jgi:hypothetical protein
MLFLIVLAAVALGWLLRVAIAVRGKKAFCGDGGCVTLAIRLKPGGRGFGWKHGYARLAGDVIEWRSEHRIGAGADLTFDATSLAVRDHRQVVKGETMLSDQCELIFARYRGEDVELGVPLPELDTFLTWPRG